MIIKSGTYSKKLAFAIQYEKELGDTIKKMEIILTHEQADFDALAALLAARLLSDASFPVLPNRINRNARKFINLYAPDLPFVETHDLPHELIESITLVDTQSLITLKGMHKNTRIHVIDHHQQRDTLPNHWILNIEKVGATTTILVEALRDHDTPFTTIQATLLLLGIYEDTGSLTYAATTVRDVNAAAFLLEKGASLRIAAEYLNPALSPDQRALAERLMENAETHFIEGKTVLLSQADAREMNEEISSIAHKLRDLLDPDALFLTVLTSEGIRIIARSTSDEINVAKIMTGFGGGGHERAASALITFESPVEPSALTDLNKKLLAEIKATVKPGLTVQKIMSKKPLLLSPQTSISEADRLMQRYGYEGYPVVENGKVVGLLTRRAVDRARNHHLKMTIGSLMDSGTYSLRPDQSLQHVQDVMAATGWGQIPVMDPASGRIIGIVTRTDLLKNLLKKDKAQTELVNYGNLLEKALPPCRLSLLKAIIESASQEHQALYIVGGFVRDLILQKPSQDFDIVVEGDAIRLARMLANKFGGRVVAHRRFGTAKWKIDEIHTKLAEELNCLPKGPCDLPESLDLISARTEFYDHPTALPIVENSSIKQDLHRRDFTINTLALRLDGSHFGELQDHWGGLKDLKKKSVKVLHSLSFVDDPTRMLRAVRFEQRFGFHIEKRTLQLMQEARENLKQVSGNRIRHEFDLIFKEVDPTKDLVRLKGLDLLSAVHPGLDWNEDWEHSLNRVLTEEIKKPWNDEVIDKASLPYFIWLSNLAIKDALSIADRLHFSNAMVKTLQACHQLITKKESLKGLSVSRFTEELRSMPESALYVFYCLIDDKNMEGMIVDFLEKWRSMEPSINGETLKIMGVPPGPRYAAILKELRDAWLDGKIKDAVQEKDYLEQIIQSY